MGIFGVDAQRLNIPHGKKQTWVALKQKMCWFILLVAFLHWCMHFILVLFCISHVAVPTGVTGRWK